MTQALLYMTALYMTADPGLGPPRFVGDNT
jgi:hypothetical protein